MKEAAPSLVALAMMVAGCSGGLPRIRTEPFDKRMGVIPAGATPVYRWTASREGLKTFWGDQDILVEADAYLPEGWKQVGDEFWRVKVWNHQGRAIPFLGLVRKYTDERGKKAAVLVPPVALAEVPEGLYLTILPNIEMVDGRVQRVQPVAFLWEIRGHAFRPFRVTIPLTPRQVSPVTPAPPPAPEPRTPPGTPIPLP